MPSRRESIVVLKIAAAIVAGLTGALHAQTYNVTLIPANMDPAGAGNIGVVYPQGISPTGEITGYFVERAASTVGSWGNVPLAFSAQATGSTVTEQYLGYVGGTYYPSDTDDYPGMESYTFGVNAAGTIVGGGTPSGGFYTLTEYAGSPMQNLPALPVGEAAPKYPCFASAINSAGVVVGASVTNAIPGTFSKRYVHAVVCTPSQGLTDLSLGTTNTSVTYAVNPAGNVAVGFSSPSGSVNGKIANLWKLSGSTWTSTSLGTLAGATNPSAQSVAYGINASQQIVGVSDTGGGTEDAFLRQASGQMIDLIGTPVTGTGGDTLGDPIPGNGLGNTMIAPSGDEGAGNGNVLNSGMSADSCADAINDLGQVVGYYNGATTPRAFIASVNSSNGVTFTDLNTLISPSMQSVWTLKEATAINDQDQIVGWGINKNVGGEAAFELSLAPIGTWNSSTGGTWTASSNWAGGIPNAPGVVATFGATPGLTSNGIITLDGTQTVGHLVFNNNGSSYTLNAGAGGILNIDDTTDLAGASPSITVSAGSHTINAPIQLSTNAGATGLTINTWVGCSLTIGGSVYTFNNGSGAVTVSGGGNVYISSSSSINVPVIANAPVTFSANPNTGSGIAIRTVPSITLGATGTVSLAPALTHSSRQLLVTTPIFQYVQASSPYSAGWVGLIDLANNDMDVPNGNLSTLTAQVAEGYAGGAWTGMNLDGGYTPGAVIEYNGIASSTAAADTTQLTALGIIQNITPAGMRLYSAFDGQPVQSTDVLIKYTYYGDADLSGVVDGSDYSRIDNGYLQGLTGWGNGDFNYDGVIDGSDYTLIDNAFNTQGASLAAQVIPTAQIAGSRSAVPEPATLSLLGLAAVTMLSNRRRRSAGR